MWLDITTYGIWQGGRNLRKKKRKLFCLIFWGVRCFFLKRMWQWHLLSCILVPILARKFTKELDSAVLEQVWLFLLWNTQKLHSYGPIHFFGSSLTTHIPCIYLTVKIGFSHAVRPVEENSFLAKLLPVIWKLGLMIGESCPTLVGIESNIWWFQSSFNMGMVPVVLYHIYNIQNIYVSLCQAICIERYWRSNCGVQTRNFIARNSLLAA